MANHDLPRPQGLYDPTLEHDACGVAFVVDLHGRRSHDIAQRGITALCNLQHRGASGCEVNTGDGAGILLQIPDRFLRAVVDFDLPEVGAYATGIAFLPAAAAEADKAVDAIDAVVADEGLRVLGWRAVPTDDSMLGATAKSVEPSFRQVFIAGERSPERARSAEGGATQEGERSPERARSAEGGATQEGDGLRGIELERRAFIVRKRIEHEVPVPAGHADGRVYFPSLSCRTLVYKGMLTTPQLEDFYLDLQDERVESALALVHSRFSTNTFPSWPLAHPYRYMSHNGEINTLKGNRNWMRAREALLASDLYPGDLERIFPICTPDASDSASFDEALELLALSGRSLPHSVLMMIPEAWENHETMSPEKRAFYQFHASLMEPWDGPASIAFTDGTVIGAVLDRNGLRPSRYWVTADGLVIMASEVGVLDVPPEMVVKKGRLEPGRMFLVDTTQGRIVDDEEIKRELAGEHPYEQWLDDGLCHLDDLPPRDVLTPQHASQVRQQRLFGWTQEEVKLLIAPMARTGVEALGSMGTDTPIATLSDRSRLLFDYFQQLFAQVTNPPLDAIREELVTSLGSTIGPEGNLLDPGPESCRQIVLPHPVLDNEDLAKLRYIDEEGGVDGYKPVTVDALYPVLGGGDGLRLAIDRIRRQVSDAIAGGVNLVILSDRYATEEHAPIPSLLITAAVHHHLIREKTRTRVGLVVETGEAREVHHIALLLGYGAAAVNPYLVFDALRDLVREGHLDLTPRTATKNYIKAAGKGVLKIMSKMGISTVASYTGAQVFEAIGLSQELVDEYFTGTTSRLGGVSLDVLAAEMAARHARAFPDRPSELAHRELDAGGEYQWRREGEFHLFNPETVFRLQHATRTKRYDIFKQYTTMVDERSKHLSTLRGLFELREGARPPVPIDEVEPVSEIVRRFSTGAMSYGSISKEAHETLAIAMNRLGGKSNTGEGGEDADRFVRDANGDLRRSAIKQVASGRFGVTSEYLVNSDDLQIKMAQGAKPGEGGQLPGHKVYPWIAKTRHSTPGVGLISPPPHHDIYSIEDLAQLIHDLKNSNPRARVHVKLVAEVGVGTVAAGVSKAHADVVLISGHDGGTGASPLTSIKHAGAPWELGLAETQQTLLLNGLRDRIVVQTDGQLKTGRDVVIAALLGAEEYGFASAPLVVSGCIMMRVCHLDTCPVGVATQNPELRKKFTGQPEFVVNFFEFVAEEVREYLAALGFRTMAEAIGHAEMLDTRAAVDHWKASGLDLTPILHVPEFDDAVQDRYCTKQQDHGLDRALDNTLIQLCEGALEDGQPVTLELPIRNVNRTVGTMLGYELTKRYGGGGLPADTIQIHFSGSAGQSFGAFVPAGITLRLEGDANDYLGKGLSGGRIIVFPPPDSPFVAEENIVAGNVILYGATGGEVFLRGVVGERFCVRNSGATAVVEGVGDHGCEYMTGGRVVVLGPTGRNFGAGMSGGIAYVHDPERVFPAKLNREMVDIDPLEDEDREFLRAVIRKHQAETGSPVAGRILDRWRREVECFVKIMPKDYKRVLEAARVAEERGIPVDEAIMAASMGEPTGFMKYERELPHRRPVAVRLRDWKEVYEPFPEENLQTQAARCMDCGIPFCHTGCPLGNLIPDWNDLVYRDDWREATERLHATNNFPEFTGRLCPAPCEAACVLGINEDPVAIKQVEVSIVEHAWNHDDVEPVLPSRETGQRVAVVGSGPAGLAAAQQLTRAGHAVTVLERADRIGGLLRYGIPEFKMEKRFLERRLDQMRAEGTEFRVDADVGGNVSVDALRTDHDAIVLAGGATAWRDLPIPGRELKGIYQAMEFLPPANRVQEGDLAEHPFAATGQRVVIIGGGDTGADCLGTVHRHGCASVHQFEILPRPPEARPDSTPWPTWPLMYRTSSAHEEGGERVFAVNTECFVGDEDGNVRALRAHEVEQKFVDGRMTFERVEGSDFELPCDLVLLAMGFVGPERAGMLDQLGVELTERGNVARDDRWMTSVDGVFVCGDMGRGQSLIVWAIAEGRACAAGVDRWLTGTTDLPAPISPDAVPIAAR